MKKIVIISYPRSGSGLILNLISYLNNENCKLEGDYGIVNDNISIIKGHDMDFSTNISDDNIYIVVLRRNVIFNILSFMRYTHMEKIRVSTREEYLSFQKKCSEMNLSVLDDDNTILNYYMYYIKFYNKWVLNDANNINMIYTEDIMTHPEQIVEKLAKIIGKENIELSYFIEKLKREASFKPDIYNEQYYYIKNLIDNYDPNDIYIDKVKKDWEIKNVCL